MPRIEDRQAPDLSAFRFRDRPRRCHPAGDACHSPGLKRASQAYPEDDLQPRATQTSPAAQAKSHWPQFCGSVPRSTHRVPQTVWPIAHVPTHEHLEDWILAGVSDVVSRVVSRSSIRIS